MDHRCLIPGCVDISDPERRPCVPPRPAALLCRRHYGRLARALDELPAVARWLHASAATSRGQREEVRITGSRTPPVPVRIDVLDHLDQIAGVLASWCRLAVEEHVPAVRGPRSDDVAATAGFLCEVLPWAETRPWVDELYGEVAGLRRRAQTLAPWQRHAHHLPAPCPACGERALVLYGGAGAVTCTSCHDRIPEDRYGLWARYLTWLHDPAA